MRAWRAWWMLAAAFAGCGQSCSCSCEGEPAPATPVTARSPAAAGVPAATPAATGNPSDTQASGAVGAAGEGGTVAGDADLKRWLEVARAEKTALEGAQKRLGSAKPGALVAALPTTLGAVLPARLGGFASQAPAGTGKVNVGAASLPVASRSYQGPKSAAGAGDIYLKLTDTSAAPEMRAPVVAALTETSSVGGYYTRGGFVRGYPAVLTYSAMHHAGKAAVLLGDRYLLEARIAPVASPDDIARILGELDWSHLVARDAK